MKLAEIEEQIGSIMFNHYKDFNETKKLLTALFIQLSEERAKEQRQICANEYKFLTEDFKGESQFNKGIHNLILNAPFPTLD